MSDSAKLGHVHDTPQGRDAVHVAIAPAVAAQILAPGDHVGLVPGSSEEVMQPNDTVQAIGIVDPFIRQRFVNVGDRFFVFLYPQTITGLRHVWTHPAFPDAIAQPVAATRAASELWLRQFCANNSCPDYEVLIAGASGQKLPKPSWAEDEDDNYYHCRLDDEYLHFGGTDAHGEIPDELWGHVENVTGRQLSIRPKYFSCSC